MRSLNDVQHQVASPETVDFISFVFDCYHMASWRSCWDGDLQIDSFFDDSSSLAGFALASFAKDVSHTFTVLTVLFSLSVHSRSNLHHLDSSSLAFAVGTLSNIWTSFAITNITQSGSFMEKRHLTSCVQFIEGDLDLFSHWLHFGLFFGTLFLATVHHFKYSCIDLSLLFCYARQLSYFLRSAGSDNSS